MTLSQKILDAARDEVLKNHGLNEWNDDLFALEDIRFEIGEPPYTSDLLNNEAAILAMEKQAKFYRSISSEGWVFLSGEWYQPHTDRNKTELELYEIFTTQQ